MESVVDPLFLCIVGRIAVVAESVCERSQDGAQDLQTPRITLLHHAKRGLPQPVTPLEIVLAGDQQGHVVVWDALAVYLHGGARLERDECVLQRSGLLPYVAFEQVVVDSAQPLFVLRIRLRAVRFLEAPDGLEVVESGVLLKDLGDVLLLLQAAVGEPALGLDLVGALLEAPDDFFYGAGFGSHSTPRRCDSS